MIGSSRTQAEPRQEFGIEIPDKDADAIHSGASPRDYLLHRTNYFIVDQAITYVVSQPDGSYYSSPSKDDPDIEQRTELECLEEQLESDIIRQCVLKGLGRCSKTSATEAQFFFLPALRFRWRMTGQSTCSNMVVSKIQTHPSPFNWRFHRIR